MEMQRREAARQPKVKQGEDVDCSRLVESMRRSRLMLRYPREQRLRAVEQYAGAHWSEEGVQETVPLNLLALYVAIVGRGLIAKNPRVMLSTFQKANKPTITAMNTWVNQELEEMHIARIFQRAIVDALFCVGCLKVSLTTPAESAHSAWGLKAGHPSISVVDLDDFVYDLHARDWSEVSFIGHRYRVPLDAVRDDSSYSSERKNLTPSVDPLFNPEGDQRISVLGRTMYGSNTEEYEEMVDLWEVYEPRHRRIVTLSCNPDAGPQGGTSYGRGSDVVPLRVQPWVGPATGPYHMLGFHVVPGNIMPKAPIQDLIDLHMLANNIYRKLSRQADRQKQILAVRGSATEDAARVQNANDGDIVRVDNPDNLKVMDFGGPNQVNMQLLLDAVNRFSTMAGNMELMGGLSPQSKTATQDKMLNENASGTMASMQDTTVTYVSSVIKSLCWYYHHDPIQVQRSTFSIPSMPAISVERAITPQQRLKVPWKDLQIKVDPYSMQHQTPQGRLQALDQLVQKTVMPMMQILQPQGITLDANAYLKKWGEYADDPDVAEILTITDPPAQEPGGGGGGPAPGMPAETTRNYVRENMPGRTQQGDMLNSMNALKGMDTGGASEQTGGQ